MKLLVALCLIGLAQAGWMQNARGFYSAAKDKFEEAKEKIGEHFGAIQSKIFNAEHNSHNEEGVTGDIEKEPREQNQHVDIEDAHFQLSQGDMIVLKPDAPAERVGNTRIKWDNKVVYYAFGDSQSRQADFKRQVRAALDDIEKCTCVRFKERTNQKNYVNVIRDQGCYSYVGEIGGPQALSLGKGCEVKGIMQHEFLHALGMEHQHSRPDRDQYVDIHLEHVDRGQENNFEKVSANQWTTLGLPYDYSSLMHYGAFDFSNDGEKTVVAPDARTFIGQREGLSEMDIKFLNKFYDCGSSYDSKKECSSEALVCENTESDRQCEDWSQHCNSRMYSSFMYQSCRKRCKNCNEHLNNNGGNNNNNGGGNNNNNGGGNNNNGGNNQEEPAKPACQDRASNCRNFTWACGVSDVVKMCQRSCRKC